MGGHGDDRQAREAAVGPEVGRGLVAVHLGHLEIHQHEIERGRLRAVRENLHRLAAVAGDAHGRAGAFEQLDRDLLVDLVVLDEEDSRAPEPARLLVRGHAGDGAPVSRITEEVHERVHDHRLGDGLDEEAVEMEPLGLLADFLAAERGDEHDRGLAGQRLVALDPADRLEPVQAGHAPVHEDEVVRRRRVGLPDGRDGFGAGGDHVDAAHDGPQWLLQDLAGGGVVVDHEHAETREAFGDDPAGGPGGAQLEPGGEGERAARAGLALQPDAPAHQLDEPPRDREPEPGAAVLARGGHVGLGEGLEEAGRLLSGHADPGVAHGELQLDLVAGTLEQTDREPDLATLGELDRVVDEVGEDLSETERVTAQVLGDRARDVGQELQPLVVGLLGGERDDRADDLVDLEVRGLEVELARLDLREVEDVVDDAEERRAGVVDLADVVALLGVERSLQREI